MKHMNRRTLRAKDLSRGFSLIEVLFAVLILGIALLGLGAFFPSVIKQQRTASDATFGVLAAQSARAQIFGYSIFSEPIASLGNRSIWKAWARGESLFGPNYRPIALGDTNAWTVVPVNTSSGAMLVYPRDASFGRATIAMADRLYPSDGSLAREPQFIWDMAVRRLARVPNASGPIPPGGDDVQVAVFVRRIDPRIQVPRNKSMFQVMSPDEQVGIRRWPISVDISTGRATQDGRFDNQSTYSTPIVAKVKFGTRQGGTSGPVVRDRLQISDYVSNSGTGLDSIEKSVLVNICSQPGQKLVDNLGNVYTVIGPDTRTESGANPATDVQITPAVAPGVSVNQLFEVVLTPQIPAEVLVFSVNP